MTRDEFLTLALRNPANQIIAEKLFELALPDAWIVSGCLVQTVWNARTGRAVDYGIHDYDVFYFDPIRHGPPRTRSFVGARRARQSRRQGRGVVDHCA